MIIIFRNSNVCDSLKSIKPQIKSNHFRPAHQGYELTKCKPVNVRRSDASVFQCALWSHPPVVLSNAEATTWWNGWIQTFAWQALTDACRPTIDTYTLHYEYLNWGPGVGVAWQAKDAWTTQIVLSETFLKCTRLHHLSTFAGFFSSFSQCVMWLRLSLTRRAPCISDMCLFTPNWREAIASFGSNIYFMSETERQLLRNLVWISVGYPQRWLLICPKPTIRTAATSLIPVGKAL